MIIYIVATIFISLICDLFRGKRKKVWKDMWKFGRIYMSQISFQIFFVFILSPAFGFCPKRTSSPQTYVQNFLKSWDSASLSLSPPRPPRHLAPFLVLGTSGAGKERERENCTLSNVPFYWHSWELNPGCETGVEPATGSRTRVSRVTSWSLTN